MKNKRPEITAGGKLPPHDLDAELNALACVLDCEQQQAEKYFEQLDERHFYGVQSLAIFRALTKIEVDGGQFNAVALAEQLKVDGQLVDVGGIEAIAAMNVADSSDFQSYLTILQDRAARRETIASAQNAIRDAQNLSAPVAAGNADKLTDKLDARLYSPKSQPDEPQPRFYLANVGITTAGNLQTILSQPKTGKTACVGGMIAASFGADADCLGWKSENLNGHAVVHLDTEQSIFDHWQLIKRAVRRAGIETAPAWLRSYCVTGFTVREIRQAIRNALETAAQKFGGIHSFILDGAADCVADVNDPAESNDFVAELHALAIQYHCPIIGVIHLNPGSEFKTRGHLGSQLERKAETNLKLEKDGDGMTVIWADKNRRAPIPKNTAPRFVWSDECGMHITASAANDAKLAADGEAIKEQIAEAYRMAGKSALHWSDFVAALLRVPGVRSQSTAERIFSKAKAHRLIKTNLIKQWEMA